MLIDIELWRYWIFISERYDNINWVVNKQSCHETHKIAKNKIIVAVCNNLFYYISIILTTFNNKIYKTMKGETNVNINFIA